MACISWELTQVWFSGCGISLDESNEDPHIVLAEFDDLHTFGLLAKRKSDFGLPHHIQVNIESESLT